MGMANAATVVLPTGLRLPSLDDQMSTVVPISLAKELTPGPGAGLRRFGKLVAASPCHAGRAGILERLARTEVTVTLLGETGTGKDVVANAIHEYSGRGGQPFVVFDCGAVPPNLAESELFGHERGAFTGAVAKHAGAFERARGGTLFLDEIGELPLDLQPQVAAGTGEPDGPPRGWGPRSPHRRAHPGGHQPGPGVAGGQQAVPARPVLPAGRGGGAPARRCASGWRTCAC